MTEYAKLTILLYHVGGNVMRVGHNFKQLSGVALLLSLSQLATADDGIAARKSSLLMEEVTVTAQKRE